MMLNAKDANTLAQGVNEQNAARTRRAEAAVNVLLAVVLAVLGAVGLVHWAMQCNVMLDGAALCMGALFAAPSTRQQVQPRHPDERLAESISAAFQAGVEHGESLHYRQGWRQGVFNGVFLGLVLGAALVAGALKLGLLVGAA